MADLNRRAILDSFNDLLLSSQDVFLPSEISEVQSYLDVHEFGLALQTYMDIAIEEKKTVPAKAIAICNELAQQMQMECPVRSNQRGQGEAARD
ncbi:MAG: hypothetical protein JNM52_02540 [Betaproteobacteria bacterium]|nr:hypothetical protein [Betaproteobacteria bacterium]